jgi:hypothetical protein
MKPRWKSEADPDRLVEAGLDTLEDIVRLMTDRRIRHVPVVTQDGRLERTALSTSAVAGGGSARRPRWPWGPARGHAVNDPAGA